MNKVIEAEIERQAEILITKISLQELNRARCYTNPEYYLRRKAQLVDQLEKLRSKDINNEEKPVDISVASKIEQYLVTNYE